MSKAKTPRLDGGLIARKGQAAPNGTPAAETAANPSPVETKNVPRGTENTIAITVRLDPERYRRLKHYGVDHRQTSQEIMVIALDAFLDANK